jgi:uncharacterized protein YbjQ (UPF0145 family)
MRTRKQTRWRSTSEVRGYSDLVRDTRRDARDQLAKAVIAQGADGVVVDEMTLHLGERECPTQERMRDHVAEAAILGTTIVSFDRAQDTDHSVPLTIMHLNPSPPATASLRPDGASRPPPQPDSEGGFLDRLVLAWAARRASRSTISSSDSANISKKAD